MWWKDRVYFLDFGMVGNLETELREHLMLLLMVFRQEDAAFLTDVTLMLSRVVDRSELDVTRYQAEIGANLS
jgi:ubiquinone biosynthesis protein